MKKKIIVTEKPSVAREYAKVLGVTEKKDGYIENDEWIITWCVGHLVTLSYPEVYDADLKKWHIDDLPFLPEKYKYEVIGTVKKQYSNIKKLYNRKDIETIYYAGDSGREGIYIQELVRRKAGHTEGIKELVVWIDSYTDSEIKRGIAEAKPISEYQKLINAAYMRAIEDYAVGINFTRALSCKFGYVRERKYRPVTVGRVMTCVLGMVVDRENEINNFKETKFYKIIGQTKDFKSEWKAVEGSPFFNSPKIHDNAGFLKEEDRDKFLKELNKDKKLTVTDFKKEEEKKYAPTLFNLAELQAECSKEFKISPSETLEIAQKLYEAKLTTYPRTDARVLTTAVAEEIGKTLKKLKKKSYREAEIDYVLDTKYKSIVSFKKYVDDSKVTDHYAIIPTGEGDESKLSDLELRVYRKIVDRLLAIFYPCAEYDKISIELQHSSNEKFFFTEKLLIKKGWMKILDNKKELSKDSIELKKGEVLDVKFDFAEGKTQPPKRYTSGSIILAMENAGNLIEDEELRAQIKGSGIGTSATRAEIIKKLCKIKYINLNSKTQALTPAPDGEIVYGIVKEHVAELLNPKMTASWEKGLSEIENGSVKRADYEKKLNNYITEIIEKIKAQEATKKGAEDMERKTIGNCPLCGKEVTTTTFGWGCSGYKDGCKFSIGEDFFGHKVTEEQVKELMDKKKIGPFDDFYSKKKKSKYSAFIIINEDEKRPTLSFDDLPSKTELKDSDLTCPKCGAKLKEGKWIFQCSDCDFKIKHTFSNKRLTDEEMKTLLAGRTALLDGFTSRDGKPFMAFIEFDGEDTKYVFKGESGEDDEDDESEDSSEE